MANRRMSGSSDLLGSQVTTLTKSQWEEARAVADEVHVVQYQARTGGGDE